MECVTSTAPLSLAIVMTSFDPGGTERQMSELARRLDRTRWSVHLACFHTRGAWFERVADSCATVEVFPVASFRSPEFVRQTWAFARWCRSLQIAVVHTAERPANIFGLPAAALAGVPVRIGNRREINPGKSAMEIGLQRAAYACAHRIVANSRAAAARLQVERVRARAISVIPNGLDVSEFETRRNRQPGHRVVVVANLRTEKGHDVLIDAAPDVLRRFPDARFELVGAGPELASLRDRARARGVAHAFDFLGERDDVPARLAAADMFLLPSRSEAFPNAVLEAMASGLPVVASGVGGILELIDDGHTGLLTPAGDPVALADRLCTLMGDPALAARLGESARAQAEQRYSFDRMVAAFDALYLDELARRGVAAAQRLRLAAS
jgi:glycosyltransferase involved in cell wall biosynthesis